MSELQHEFEELDQVLSPSSVQPMASLWLLLVALGAVIVGGGLAIAGLVGPGFLLFGIGLAGVVWHIIARQTFSVMTSRIVTPRQEHRIQLGQLIAARQREDDAYDEAQRQIAEAERLLREATTLLGGSETGAEDQVIFLQEWELAHRRELQRADQERHEWDELQKVLGEQSLEELESELERSKEEVARLAAHVEADALTSAAMAIGTETPSRSFRRRSVMLAKSGQRLRESSSSLQGTCRA